MLSSLFTGNGPVKLDRLADESSVRLHIASIVPNETRVELGQTVEDLDIVKYLRLPHELNCLDLLQVWELASFQNQVAKNKAKKHYEQAFLWIEAEAKLPALVEVEGELAQMSGEIAVDAKIIKEDAHELTEVVLEDPHDDPLVGGWSIGQSKRHEDPDVGTPFGDEPGLVLVGRKNANRVVLVATIHECV